MSADHNCSNKPSHTTFWGWVKWWLIRHGILRDPRVWVMGYPVDIWDGECCWCGENLPQYREIRRGD